MKKAVLSLSALSVAMMTTGAIANDDSSFYVGGRVGAHLFENACKIESCDNTKVAAGVILGYDFGNMFAIEGTYDFLGSVSSNSQTFKPADGDLTTLTLAPKFSYGISDRTDVYAKVGATWWNFDSNYGSLDDIGYLGAIGLDHRASDLINLRLEYQYIGGMDQENLINGGTAGYKFEGDSHLISAGITMHFGRSSAPVIADTSLEEDFQPGPVVDEVLVPELFSSVQFAFDRNELTSEAISLLQPTLQRLQDIPESTAVVSGYTDSIGSEDYNEALSLERAQTVAQYFATNGIEARRMIIQGLGESSPIATNNTSEGRKMNRRVEVYSPELIIIEQ